MSKPTREGSQTSLKRNLSRRSSFKKRVLSFVWLFVHLPTVLNGKIGNLVYHYWQKVLPSRRAPFPGFSESHPEGVNLVAYIRAEVGLGQAARGIAAALEAAQLPFSIVDFEIGHYAARNDSSWRHKETRNPTYDVTLLAVNPDNIANAKLWLPKALSNDRYVIGYWFWELPEIPDSWLWAFSLVDEVWVASQFVQDGMAKRSPVPIIRIPPVIELSSGTPLSRQHLNLPEKQFLFLSMYDAGSVMERKNPHAAIRAFKQAFAKDDREVGLALKVRDRNPFRGQLAALRQEIHGWSNIHLLDQSMTRNEINSLLSVTDCFVSLHRSEGFGLVPAEAMSLGKPVIMTRWSGNTDYMTPNNSIGIDYQLIKLERDYGPYKKGQVWAEPDVEQAADWMKKLAGDRDLATTIGKRGQETIQHDFSSGAVGNLIRQRLSEIRKQHRGGTP